MISNILGVLGNPIKKTDSTKDIKLAPKPDRDFRESLKMVIFGYLKGSVIVYIIIIPNYWRPNCRVVHAGKYYTTFRLIIN